MGAVVWASTLCRPYLRGVHFELVTDSKVVAVLTKDTRPPRRENFIARMMEFDFTPVHRKGELNRNADFFGRWARYKEYEEEQKMKIHALNSLVREDLQRWRHNEKSAFFQRTKEYYTASHSTPNYKVSSTTSRRKKKRSSTKS